MKERFCFVIQRQFGTDLKKNLKNLITSLKDLNELFSEGRNVGNVTLLEVVENGFEDIFRERDSILFFEMSFNLVGYDCANLRYLLNRAFLSSSNTKQIIFSYQVIKLFGTNYQLIDFKYYQISSIFFK
jgi:hypothetical protein